MSQTSQIVLTFECPACGAKLRVSTEIAGVEGPCPRCQTKIKSPLPDSHVHGQELDPLTANHNERSTNVGTSSLADGDFPTKLTRPSSASTPIPDQQRTTDQRGPLEIIRKQKSSPRNQPPTPKPFSGNTKKSSSRLLITASLILMASTSVVAYRFWTESRTHVEGSPTDNSLLATVPDPQQGLSAQANSTVTETKDPQSDPSDPLIPPAPEEQPIPPPVKLDAAQLTLEAFLKASTVEERTQHILNANKLLPRIIEYYTKNPIALQAKIIPSASGSSVSTRDTQFRIFHVITTQQNDPFVVFLENTSTGWKVSWTSFTQFNDNSLGKFIQNHQLDPVSFYTKLKRAHFFGTGIPKLGSKICFRIQPPIDGHEGGYVFTDRDSEMAKFAEKEFEWGEQYYPIVRLQWVKTEDGDQYIEIAEIEEKTWRSGQDQPSTITPTS